MDSPVTKHTIKRQIADTLLEKLAELYPDDLLICCNYLGIQLSELSQNSPSFSKKGVPNTTSYRYVHHEERRLAKILKAASELSKSVERNLYIVTPSLTSLYKSLEIPTSDPRSLNSSLIVENISIFQKPDDLILYNIEKTKQKFNKSVEVIKRLESLRAEEKRKAEELVKKVNEKEKKRLKNLNRKDENQEKNTMNNEDYRNKILQRKKKINEGLDQKFSEFGDRLKNRLEKLSHENQKKVFELMMKKQEKIRKKVDDEYMKMANHHNVVKAQIKEIESSVKQVEEKVDVRVKKYEENIQRRIWNMKENNEKVDRIFSKNLEESSKRNEENLIKAIEKSQELEQKRIKKQEKYDKYASTMRTNVMSNFVRKNRGIEGLNHSEVMRIQNIENRVNEKTKLFNQLKLKFDEAIKEKRQKNTSRFEHHSANYNSALENKAKFRSRIIEEHMRINNLTEDFKKKKDYISVQKKSDNFEIQKLRSGFTASIKKRYISKANLDLTI